MALPIITGIQQVGIGIPNVHEAFGWYRRTFGMDIPIFEEAADAELMLPYTGGEARSRHAILAVNLQGGGGMEIWQYTSRTPVGPSFEIQTGDLGIFAARIKCLDVAAMVKELQGKGLTVAGGVQQDPGGNPVCWVQDPYGNWFQVAQSDSWFSKGRRHTGGIAGCMIGSSDIEAARKLYSDLLGYDQVVYDKSGTFEDLAGLPSGHREYRRVLLTHSKPRQGGFSRMFGQTHIELIQALDREPKKMFEGRMWGDLGFIHLCFDIVGMDELRKACAEKDFPFTVDSAAALGKEFDMGEAAGSFSYIEDPDGTLIEFVETFKLPLIKKIGWYLDMRKRNPAKPLPNWMLKTLGFGRVK
ncbi:MAG: VOC family protein, partial [Bacteroidota bacterium]